MNICNQNCCIMNLIRVVHQHSIQCLAIQSVLSIWLRVQFVSTYIYYVIGVFDAILDTVAIWWWLTLYRFVNDHQQKQTIMTSSALIGWFQIAMIRRWCMSKNGISISTCWFIKNLIVHLILRQMLYTFCIFPIFFKITSNYDKFLKINDP